LKKFYFIFFSIFLIATLILPVYVTSEDSKTDNYKIDYQQFLNPAPNPDLQNKPFIKPYLDFFTEVYETMDQEYYLPVSEEIYQQFVNDYKVRVLTRLKDKENVVPEIKHLGAGLLTNKLKSPTDTFSTFIPPIIAEEYESEILGYELGLGITGHLVKTGYLIDKVEFRSDSYQKGIRAGD